ncbi:MAG: alpha-glucan phosphorylase, partial [Thermodesulfobacteriota bacterium]|nr:alpha-glucan phosphorylase [Thermodesulfobacteriota bacterium]
WWDEGYGQEYGWAIGRGETYDDLELQNEVESRDIYNLLEREIVPAFYERGLDNLPHGWLEKMKAAMFHLCPNFNSHRMVQDYVNHFYISGSNRHGELSKDDMKGAEDLALWRQKLMTNWDQIRINGVHVHDSRPVPVSGLLSVGSDVYLHELLAEDVDVEIYVGPLSFEGEFTQRETIPMKAVDSDGNGNHHFEGQIPCSETGRYGFTIRIMPSRQKMETPYTTGLVVWAPDEAIVGE